MDEVLIICVNDGAVMQGWAKDLGVQGSMITFLSDTCCELTKALGLVLDAPAALEKLGNPRCQRFALLVQRGIIKTVKVAGVDGATNEDTYAKKMLELC